MSTFCVEEQTGRSGSYDIILWGVIGKDSIAVSYPRQTGSFIPQDTAKLEGSVLRWKANNGGHGDQWTLELVTHDQSAEVPLACP